MHELSIATALLDVCERELEANGGGRMESASVVVGELSAVEPDLLRFAWEALLEDTPHTGAGLEIEFRPARQTCPTCGEMVEREAGAWLRCCPECARPLQVDGGYELDLLSISVLQELAAPPR